MAIQYQYQYAIDIDLLDSSLFSIESSANADTYYVDEGTVSDDDGTLEVNLVVNAETVGLSTDGATYSDAGTYIGATVGGGIIYQDGLGDYYLLSNNGSLTGTVSLDLLNTDTEICFAKGTLIATPEGARRVEDLAAGDMVMTANGRAVPVKWIGHQTVSGRFSPIERRSPVRFLEGSLGEGVPYRDLVVTSDHAIFIDGIAIHAGALVNGTSILRDGPFAPDERVTFYHVETADHEIILANGAAAETFVDHVSRRNFDNYAEYAALFGDEEPVAEMDYPRAMSPRQIPLAIRRRFGLDAAA